MDRAIKELQKDPAKAIARLLADPASRKRIVKKVSSLIMKKKIWVPAARASAKTSKKEPVKTKQFWEVRFSSPAVEERVSADPYDDSLMEDFGELAEIFGCGSGAFTQTHQSKKGAIDAAVCWVEEDSGLGLAEDELSEVRRGLEKEGSWAHEEELLVELSKCTLLP